MDWRRTKGLLQGLGFAQVRKNALNLHLYCSKWQTDRGVCLRFRHTTGHEKWILTSLFTMQTLHLST